MQFPKKNLTVFPTSRAIREFIQEKKPINQLLPKYCTIGDFFTNITIIGDKQFCEEELRILYLKEALENIETANIGINSQFNMLLKQSDYLFRFFAELTHENKTIQQLSDYDVYAFYQDHLETLEAIYNAYVAILKANDKVDKITLPFEYQLNFDYIEQFDAVEIYYEGYFSSFEFSLLLEISKLVNLKIEMTQNRFNPKNIEIFKKVGIELEPNYSYSIDLSNQIILNKQPIEKIPQNVQIEKSSQRIAQIGFIKYQITQMVQQGIDAEKIIVVLPDESYFSYLQVMNEERYFNFAMGNSIDSHIFIKVLDAIYKLLIDFEPYDKDKIKEYDLDEAWIFQTLKIQLNKPINKDTYGQIIDYVLKYEQNQELLLKIQIVLLKLEKLFFETQLNVTLKEVIKILIQRFKEITLDDVHGGKVTVMGLLETRLLNPLGVIVIDFNDHIVPKRSVKDKFISSQIKEQVGLPTTKDREDLQKYYYAKLFANAKAIAISYVDDEQSGLSRFAYELFDDSIINQRSLYSYEDILLNSIQTKFEQREIIQNIDLSKQSWSATSLKTYLTCKRKYYYHYIAKIDEHHTSIKPQGFELGDILHKALYKLYGNNPLQLIFEQFKQKLYSNIDELAHQNAYLLLDIEIWKRKLDIFIENEFKRFEAGVKPLALEQPFKFEYNGITIKGAIDRIDEKANSIEVLDYKTSSSLKVDNSKNYIDSVDFQLEFYYLAANQMFQNKEIRCFYYDLNDAGLKEEVMLDQKLLLLNQIFENLHTQSVSFELCEEKKHCEFCNYKVMCGR